MSESKLRQCPGCGLITARKAREPSRIPKVLITNTFVTIEDDRGNTVVIESKYVDGLIRQLRAANSWHEAHERVHAQPKTDRKSPCESEPEEEG